MNITIERPAACKTWQGTKSDLGKANSPVLWKEMQCLDGHGTVMKHIWGLCVQKGVLNLAHYETGDKDVAMFPASDKFLVSSTD